MRGTMRTARDNCLSGRHNVCILVWVANLIFRQGSLICLFTLPIKLIEFAPIYATTHALAPTIGDAIQVEVDSPDAT